MKRLTLALLAFALFAGNLTADAQQTRKRTRRARAARRVPAGDSTYTFGTRDNRGKMGKSMSTSTDGVPGETPVRVNEKGATINKNYNTGVPLPPSSGESGR